ncbi:MAG: autotransporter-associated beta strand repeat-containing protein, partial [Patescibacteria group bacterium]|nr:autotransporter-associated beta strand repeat-containing protein [Patescibacteria group bacterium]
SGGDAVAGAKGGDGGIGLAVDITGNDVYYGGGGGGTPHRNSTSQGGGAGGLGGGGAGLDVAHTTANSAEANTGGGGGASRSDLVDYYTGGAGGSGIVIVRYLGDPVATGGTISAGTGSATGYTLHTFTDVGAHTLEVSNTIDAAISGSMTGSGGFTWDSAGTLTLSGTSDYTGATRVTAGTLALTGAGSIGGSATIDVHSGATFDVTGTTGTYAIQSGQTLMGTGTIRGQLIMNAGSWLAPGASPSILTQDGDLTLDGAGLLVDLWSHDGPGDGHDLVAFVSGDLTLLNDPRITVDLGGFRPELGSSYTIIIGFENELTDGFNPNVLVQNPGDPLSLESFRIDYGPGSIALTFIPEPGALVILAMGLLGLLAFGRRRRS